MLKEEYVVEVIKLLMEFYDEYGERVFNGSVSIAMRNIAEKTYQEYAYSTFSFCYVDGKKPDLEQLEFHRKYNDSKYGDYQLHDILNRFRRDSMPPEWQQETNETTGE